MMTSLTMVQAVLTHAKTFARYVREQGHNAGQAIEHWLKRTGRPKGDPWCMAWARCAIDDMVGAIPALPMTASCDVLLEAARMHKVLFAAPERGDLFLYMKSANDATHTGFVTDVRVGTGGVYFDTVEGNTGDPSLPPDDPRAREGWGVFERKGPSARKLVPGRYRFVRWRLLVS